MIRLIVVGCFFISGCTVFNKSVVDAPSQGVPFEIVEEKVTADASEVTDEKSLVTCNINSDSLESNLKRLSYLNKGKDIIWQASFDVPRLVSANDIPAESFSDCVSVIVSSVQSGGVNISAFEKDNVILIKER